MSPGPWLALAVLVTTSTASCEEPAGDDSSVVAYVGQRPLHLNDLEEYFAASLIGLEGEGEPEPGGSADEVKSRLLDALIEETLLVVEAEARGIEVSDVEVAAYLAYGDGSEGETVGGSRREAEARRRVRIEKLQEQLAQGQSPPADDEIAAYIAEHGSRLLRGRTVELRALQLRSRAEADQVYQDLRAGRVSFAEAMIAHEPSPGQTMAVPVSWEGLSGDVRRAIQELEAGQVSPPVELHGRVYLFEVASWLDEPGDRDAELYRRAQQELESTRHQQLLDGLLQELRTRIPVRIRRPKLPFTYVPPAD